MSTDHTRPTTLSAAIAALLEVAASAGVPQDDARAEAESLADRIGVLHRGELLSLEPDRELKRRYGATTLEEAFFAATGRTLEDEVDDSDEREVFA